MKKETFFDILWGVATPFFIIFFFILLLLYTQGFPFLKISMTLLSILILAPSLTELILVKFFNIDKKSRIIINLILIFIGSIYSFFAFVIFLSVSIQFIFIVFILSVIVSYFIFFLRLNQYSFLVGVLLAVTFLLNIVFVVDLSMGVVIELLFSAILFHLFIYFDVDDLKGLLMTYTAGFVFTFILSFIVRIFV